MGREQWLKLPPVARMLLVVGGLLLLFFMLTRPLPAALDIGLAVVFLGLGLAYAGWEWGLIQRKKADLKAQLRQERRDWQQGLPAHLRRPESATGPSSEPPAPNPPPLPEEGP